MNTKKILMICLGILMLAVIVTYFIFTTEPTAKSEGATRESAMLVELVDAEFGNFNPVIVATGTVQPVEDINLSALVGGQIIRRSPAFTPGGFVEKGAVLLQIDPSDYRNNVELSKSNLMQSRTNLEMEMGRQEVAEQDLQLAGIDSLSSQERALVLRKPQLDAIRASVRAAEAAVSQEELNLSRTTIRAPLDAHILSQNVSLGSQVAPGDNLGRLVGSESYWVILTVPVSQLQWLQFSDSLDDDGSRAEIGNSTAWTEGTYREGILEKQVGALDEQTRLARVLVRVPDPLARDEKNKDKPELMIGAFVETRLQGKEVENVVRLNRDYIRTNQTVWVMEDGKLSIREVKILLTDAEYAYVSQGLSAGDKIVTTNLSTVSEGIRLRTEELDTITNNTSENQVTPEQ